MGSDSTDSLFIKKYGIMTDGIPMVYIFMYKSTFLCTSDRIDNI